MDAPQSQPTTVVYDPPGMGTTRVPNPISGEGTLAIGPEGLTVVGRKRRDLSAVAVLAALAAVALGVYLVTSMGLSDTLARRLSIAMALGAVALITSLRFTGNTQIEVHYPWNTVRKLRYDNERGALVLLIKGAKPQGELFIRQTKDSPLQRELEARLAQQG